MAKRSVNARFGFIQSIVHAPYFIFLYELLSGFCKSKYREYSYLDKRTGKTYVNYNFWTTVNPFFTELYYVFYVNGVKVVPSDLSLFTALALAHMIMQDGSLGTSGGLYLCTDGFTPEDTKRLADYISTQFGLSVTTPKAPGKKGALRIYVQTPSMDTLRSLVTVHTHSSMLYKLGL